jgi:hypothetical protein
VPLQPSLPLSTLTQKNKTRIEYWLPRKCGLQLHSHLTDCLPLVHFASLRVGLYFSWTAADAADTTTPRSSISGGADADAADAAKSDNDGDGDDDDDDDNDRPQTRESAYNRARDTITRRPLAVDALSNASGGDGDEDEGGDSSGAVNNNLETSRSRVSRFSRFSRAASLTSRAPNKRYGIPHMLCSEHFSGHFLRVVSAIIYVFVSISHHVYRLKSNNSYSCMCLC